MKRIVLVGVFLVLLSSVFANITAVPAGTLEEASLEVKKQFALAFLEKVAAINTSVYTINFTYTYTDEVPLQEWSFSIYLNHPNASYKIRLVVLRSVVNWFVCEGNPLIVRDELSILDAARETLEAYMFYLNASYCAQFLQSLDQVTPSQNQTLRIGNLTLEVTEDGSRFRWEYTIDDIEVAFKSFSLKVSDDGHLIRLSNWWGITSIGSTEVNISEEQAINMSLPFAQKYAEDNGHTIKSIGAELVYNVDMASQRGDKYIIYPVWNVDINFTESPTDPYIFGYFVSIWADNGKLGYQGEQGVYPDAENQSSFWPLVLASAAVACFFALISVVAYKKRYKRQKVE